MKYYVEESLSNFKFWGGAADRANKLDSSDLDRFEDMISDYLGEDPSDTDINDLFWYDFAEVCHALGYACIDDEPVEDASDVPEDTRLDKLREYLDSEDCVYTEEQLKALDQKLLDADLYELDADNDDLEDIGDVKDEAREVGIKFDALDYSDEERRDVLKKYLDEMELKYTDKQVADLDELLLDKGDEYFVDAADGLSLPNVEDSLLKQVGITEEEE